METFGLKSWVLDKVRSDATLFGKVSDAVGVGPLSLPRTLRENDPRLTQANVLKVIADHLGEQDTNLFLELQVIPQI